MLFGNRQRVLHHAVHRDEQVGMRQVRSKKKNHHLQRSSDLLRRELSTHRGKQCRVSYTESRPVMELIPGKQRCFWCWKDGFYKARLDCLLFVEQITGYCSNICIVDDVQWQQRILTSECW